MPLNPTRAALFVGPCRIVKANTAAASCSIFTKDDVSLEIATEYKPKTSSFHGEFDKTFFGAHVKAGFTPSGHVNADLAALLWNDYMNLAMGFDLTTAADVPTLFHDSSGNGGGTIIASAITKLPDLHLGVDDSLFGAMEISGVIGTGLAPTAASSLYTIGGNTTVVDTTLTSTQAKQQAYTAAWSGTNPVSSLVCPTGFASFEAETKWTISANLKVKMHAVQGTIRKITYQGIEVMAKCVPVGPTPAQLLTAIGVSAASQISGRAQSHVSWPLVITGTDTTTTLTIPLASLVSAGFRFGDEVLRQGEYGWYASRPFSTGAQAAMSTLVAPGTY